ncbi:MAG: methyltransferase domain-containing protein [Pseudonocardiales bacterium]|nr:methyltransferase domain-containing protein [Pseudonocardiales bacterium]
MIGTLNWIAEKFDRRALSYDHSAMHRWQAAQAVRFLAPRAGADVLDAATGTGLVARELVGWLGPSRRVVGIDVSVEMLRRARQVCNPSVCCFIRADAQALPFCGGVFDAVVCVAAVPYFADPQAALAEWRRVCSLSRRPMGSHRRGCCARLQLAKASSSMTPVGRWPILVNATDSPLSPGGPATRSAMWSSSNHGPTRGPPSHSSTRAFVNRCERRRPRFASGSGSGLRRCIALSPPSTTWLSWCGCGPRLRCRGWPAARIWRPRSVQHQSASDYQADDFVGPAAGVGQMHR